ncbi:MAG: methyltransferase domain-containing protein [Candidatus Electrothrix sp. AU1_5]|nr:methyltransferase domain-containing protein [Candidatus Electrothrix gigas]
MNAIKELYRVEQLPVLQNRMYATEQEAVECPKGDVVLVQDNATGLIYNQSFRPELVQYDQEYQNEQAVSESFRLHLEEVSTIFRRHYQNYSLLEIGCGKGFFLEYLQKLGFEITGADPAYEGRNPRILKKYFTSDLNIRSEGIILRHVLEHIQHPVSFLKKIAEANKGTGKVYIEVPCFDWISQHRTWFDIFYEHVNYFRLADFKEIFGTVYEAGHVFGGQYLYAIADLATLREPVCRTDCQFEFPKDFLSSVEKYAEKIKKTTVSSIIWGGASKGVIFSVLLQRAGTKADFVVDINPAKQGKYVPATGLLVQPYEDIKNKLNRRNADIFIMNSNYSDEIKKITENQFNYIEVDCCDI